MQIMPVITYNTKYLRKRTLKLKIKPNINFIDERIFRLGGKFDEQFFLISDFPNETKKESIREIILPRNKFLPNSFLDQKYNKFQ